MEGDISEGGVGLHYRRLARFRSQRHSTSSGVSSRELQACDWCGAGGGNFQLSLSLSQGSFPKQYSEGGSEVEDEMYKRMWRVVGGDGAVATR